jgi:hypothetical protein
VGGRRGRRGGANLVPMVRGFGWFVGAVVAVGLAGRASADPFGGFSRDQTCYLDGADRVCAPVAPGDATPSCAKVTPEGIAKLGFTRGTPQRGAAATVTAEAAGGVLRLRSASTKAVLVEWKSPDAITRVRDVFVSGNGGVAAVEYDVRVGGRALARVVAMALPNAAAAAGGGRVAAPAKVARVTLTPAQVKAVSAALKESDRLLARKQWEKAEAAYRKALAIDEQSAAARFGVAAALARRGKATEAIAELEALAASPDEAMPVWRVEARTSAHFAGMRSDPGYRRAVGIDPDPARPLSTYERLVGQGGHWEQPGLPCQEPTVNLKLDRAKKTFVLKIRTRCQGDDETTTLDGRWKVDAGGGGGGGLVLTFPNATAADENLECALAEKAGEDTLACALEDMAFSMRVVRR